MPLVDERSRYKEMLINGEGLLAFVG